MDQLRLGVAALALAIACSSPVVTTADDPPSKRAPEPAPKPLVAAVWVKLGACGAREVVIEPSADRLKARGLTVQQLAKAVQGRRFVSGEWLVVIDDKQYDLTAEDMTHISVGEPLETFGKVEVRGKQETPASDARGVSQRLSSDWRLQLRA